MSQKRTSRGLSRAHWALLPAGWTAAMGLLAWQVPDGSDVLPALAAAPALSAAAGARRLAVLGSGGFALAAMGADLATDQVGGPGTAAGTAGAVLTVLAAGMWTAGRRSALGAELDRAREIAAAAQQVLLPALPRRLGDVTVTGEYVSASLDARIGGDFYEAVTTPFGVRALIGDARGHGLPAIGVAAALLGCFREAAHQEPDPAGVVRRLDGALRRHLLERVADDAARGEVSDAAEEFATLQLVQIDDDGTLLVVNCGHPAPYLLGPRTGPLPLGDDPLPPLGLFDAPRTPVPVSTGRLAPGEGLLLHTDGVTDTRDAAGRYFPLPDTLNAMAARRVRGTEVAGLLRDAVVRHAGGRCADDVAVLVLLRDGSPRPAVPRGTALSAS